MDALNWGIPPLGGSAKPGDLVSCVISQLPVIGFLCEDHIGKAVLVLKGDPNLGQVPMFVSVDAMNIKPSRIEGKVAFAALEPDEPFLSAPDDVHRNGQLVVLSDGSFAISLTQNADRIVFQLSDGTPAKSLAGATRYSRWRLLIVPPEGVEPVELYRSA